MLHPYITALRRSSQNLYAFMVNIQVFSILCTVEEGMANACIRLTMPLSQCVCVGGIRSLSSLVRSVKGIII